MQPHRYNYELLEGQLSGKANTNAKSINVENFSPIVIEYRILSILVKTKVIFLLSVVDG